MTRGEMRRQGGRAGSRGLTGATSRWPPVPPGPPPSVLCVYIYLRDIDCFLQSVLCWRGHRDEKATVPSMGHTVGKGVEDGHVWQLNQAERPPSRWAWQGWGRAGGHSGLSHAS